MGRFFRAGLLAAVPIAVVGVAWDVFQWGGNRATLLATDLSTIVTPLLATAACHLAASRTEGRTRASWRFLGFACFAWALGDAAWTYYNFRGGAQEVAVPFPSWADAGYLALIPLAAIGVLAIPSSPGAPGRVRAALDGIIISCALFFLSWATVLRPVYQEYPVTDADSAVKAVIGVAYPVGDVVLLTVLLVALARASVAARRPLYWLVGGFLLFLVSDSFFDYLTATGTYGIGQYVSDGWLVGFLLIGLGALRSLDFPATAAPAETPTSRWSAAIPLGTVLLASVMAVRVEVKEGSLDPVLFWTALVVVTAAVVRQFLTVLSERRLAVEEAEALQVTRAAEAARIQLINNVAHDVGTPLTPILLQVGVLQHKTSGLDEPTRHAVQVIDRNARHLKALLSDFLDVARMDAGRLRIVQKPTDLGPLVRGCVESFADQAQQRRVDLSLACPEHLGLDADADRITQVFYNLLTNALKFTPAGGKVRITVTAVPDAVVVEIADTGRGFAPESAGKLFKPFSQLHDPTTLTERGTGLGLYISRSIVEGHGGSMVGSSPGLGKGAVFLFRLPRTPASIAAAPAPLAPPS